MVSVLFAVLLAIGCSIVLCILGFFLGVQYTRRLSEQTIGSAEEQANKILNDALKEAKDKKKEALIEAKDEMHKLREEADKEIKERRLEIQRQERRISQKEENLDKKLLNAERKDEILTAKLKSVEEKYEETLNLKNEQLEILEKISGLSQEQAKELLLSTLEGELNHEKSVKIKMYEQTLKEESETKAREIISAAIQRCAADHVSEATISVVPLPSDDMKGRIIGREGRNIRSLETLTGVDLIIDDTPEAITLSGFDPVRREIARATLEKLISDGRIHPSRIEDMYEKSKREIEYKIKSEGERAVMEVGIHGINPEIIKLIGRLQFRTSYGQNVLNHSLEVSNLAGLMAAEIGADVATAKRAGLLHDIGKAVDHEVEGSHVQIGADLAKKYKESKEVIHAILAHHGDIEAKTIAACLVQAADAISAARPGARRENIEHYIKRLEKLEEIASSFAGVEKTFAIQAGREIRIMVKPDVVNDDQMTLLAREIVRKIESDMDYPGQIKVHIIRENRAIEYAK